MLDMYRYLILLVLLFSTNLHALEKPGKELLAAKIKTVLGTPLDLSLEFTDSKGVKAPLTEHFKAELPIVLVPGYFDCPQLCGLVFGGVSKVVQEMDLTPGDDYKILTVSFDPEDTPEKAQEKEAEFNKRLEGTENKDNFWQFLVGDQDTINQLLVDLGYKYLRDGDDYAHTAAVYLISPNGKISQYFSGVRFKPFDFRLALIEASEGKIGSFLDQALLFCFRYDHLKGKYAWVVQSSLRIVGVLTIVFLVVLFIWLKRRETVG